MKLLSSNTNPIFNWFFHTFWMILLITSIAGCKVESPVSSSPTEINPPQNKTKPSKNGTAVLSSPNWIAMLNLVTNTIDVYDPNDTDWNDAGSKLMSWAPTTGRGYTSAEVSAWGDVMDVKLRNIGGVDVWVTYAGGLVTTVTKSTGNKRWARIIGIPMAAHSVELLPNGCVAVAGKNDNKVYLYSTTTSNFASFPLDVARATLWDPTLDRLWVTGMIGSTHVMTALIVGGTAASPTLTEDLTRRKTLPGCCGHDISPVYGDPNKLFLAENKNYTYDKTTKLFAPAPGAVNQLLHVKSIGNMTTGEIVTLQTDAYMVPTPNPTCSGFNDWSSCWAYVYSSSGVFLYKRYVSGNCFYKARIWNPNYQ
ncbi:DUF6528 family protein [Pedobacter sp.]